MLLIVYLVVPLILNHFSWVQKKRESLQDSSEN